jgi:hypothetical protein
VAPTAYLDEAFSAGPIGVYVVAAVLVPPERADGLRLDLRQFFSGKRRRFHWHHETTSDRERMMELIATAGVTALSATTCLRDSRMQERARGLALERVLWELRTLSAGHLVLESRQARNDQQDRRRIIGAQRAGRASGDLTYVFRRPDMEPLLWLADAVASAVRSAEFDVDQSTITRIEHVLTCIRL